MLTEYGYDELVHIRDVLDGAQYEAQNSEINDALVKFGYGTNSTLSVRTGCHRWDNRPGRDTDW